MKRHPRIRRAPRDGTDPATQIAFAATQPPPLEPGSYTVTATQTVGPMTPSVSGGYQTTMPLTVASNRFQLGAGDLLSVYPANGWSGNADGQLPFAVLTKPTLPWTYNPPDSGTAVQTNGCSRLGILIFQAADAPALQQFALSAITPSDGSTAWPPGAAALTAAECPDQQVSVIDVPSALFATVAPMASDLPYVSHVRTLADGGGNTQSIYALVVGTGIVPAGPCTAFLVSLDGYSSYLVASAGGSLPEPSSGGPWSAYRMVVLSSWNFTNTDATVGFMELAQNLTTGALQWPQNGNAATTPLQLGYVAMPHVLRDGDTTVSLYRGPLVPNALNLDCQAGNATDPDALLRYDPTTGLFDTSYSVAWQLGQLLAANNARILTAQNQIAVAQMQSGNLQANRAVFAGQVPALEPEVTRTSRALRRAMLHTVARHAGRRETP